MNPDSGEMRFFNSEEDVPYGWTEWKKGETIKVKDCYFKVQGINVGEGQLILKAISELEAMSPRKEADFI